MWVWFGENNMIKEAIYGHHIDHHIYLKFYDMIF